MSFLIDGYNLLHAMGILGGRAGPHGLEKARLGLLSLLHDIYGEEASTVTVVFDAAHPPVGAPEVREFHGIHVRFAVHEAEADDLIEALIRQELAPRHLTVVSDDHRIQRAAQRRHCTVLGCGAYMDWLEQHRRRRRPRATEVSPKPDGLSREEAQFWLQEFADMQNDPNLKELSEPWEWDDGL
jgi:predicted RNA-binding protein with PIN domain